MTRTFKEMPYFSRQWKQLGFDDDALRGLQNIILDDPESGDIIKGTGGVRKLRFAFVGQGKSGSCRVCYIDLASYETVYLLTVYKKADKENLSAEEKNNIKTLVKALEQIEREANHYDTV